jgi:hypothetical protein
VGDDRYDGPSGIQPIDGYYYYEGFFDYRNQWHFDEKHGRLIEAPVPSSTQDLCLQIAGRGMFWLEYDTNVVRIPAEVLSSVLAAENKK